MLLCEQRTWVSFIHAYLNFCNFACDTEFSTPQSLQTWRKLFSLPHFSLRTHRDYCNPTIFYFTFPKLDKLTAPSCLDLTVIELRKMPNIIKNYSYTAPDGEDAGTSCKRVNMWAFQRKYTRASYQPARTFRNKQQSNDQRELRYATCSNHPKQDSYTLATYYEFLTDSESTMHIDIKLHFLYLFMVH